MFANLNNHQITKSNKFHVRISLDNCLVSKSQHKTNQLDCSRQQNKQNRKSFEIITSFIIAKKSKVEKSPRYFKRVIIVENFRATAQFNKPHNILKHPQIHLNSLKRVPANNFKLALKYSQRYKFQHRAISMSSNAKPTKM